jgi:hypothetical protein
MFGEEAEGLDRISVRSESDSAVSYMKVASCQRRITSRQRPSTSRKQPSTGRQRPSTSPDLASRLSHGVSASPAIVCARLRQTSARPDRVSTSPDTPIATLQRVSARLRGLRASAEEVSASAPRVSAATQDTNASPDRTCPSPCGPSLISRRLSAMPWSSVRFLQGPVVTPPSTRRNKSRPSIPSRDSTAISRGKNLNLIPGEVLPNDTALCVSRKGDFAFDQARTRCSAPGLRRGRPGAAARRARSRRRREMEHEVLDDARPVPHQIS